MMTVWRVVKHKRFIIGFIIFAGILFASIAFNSVIRPLYPAHFNDLLYDKEGYLIDKAPFSPSWQFPMGSDSMGVPFELDLLPGAKQVIGVALAITFFRVLLSFLLSIAVASLKQRAYKFVIHILDVFQFIPATLLAFIVIAPVHIKNIGQREIFLIIVLTLVALPNLTALLAAEIKAVKDREFIQVTRTIGGGPWHIFRYHIMKFLKSKLVILFNQQIIQVLVLMIALALLYVSTISWMGYLTGGQFLMWVWRWMLIDPAASVFVIIVSIQLMGSAIRRVAEGEDLKERRKRRGKKEETVVHIDETSFTLLGSNRSVS